MQKISNNEDLVKYFEHSNKNTNRVTEMSSIYFLITHENGYKEPVYLFYEQDSLMCSPCKLVFLGNSMVGNELFEYVKSHYTNNLVEAYTYEQSMMLNGRHYNIECEQAKNDMLPDNFFIEAITEQDCIKWLVDKTR